MLDKRELSSLVDMTKDIIKSPLEKYQDNDYLDKLFNSDLFTQAEFQDLNSAIKILLGSEKNSEAEKNDLMNNMWKVNFKEKPVSPEEFCTYPFLGPTADSLFPHVKDTFIKFYDPIKCYSTLVEYWPIGSGKSFLVSLTKAYTSYILNYLRDPKKYFPNCSETTHIVDVTISLSLDMAFDLNIRPFDALMGSSPKFHKCRTVEQLEKKKKEDPSKIYYTTATKGNSILRVGDLNFHAVSDPSQLLGLTTISTSLSEITFMMTRGMKAETVMRLLTDAKERVFSRFGRNLYAKVIVDSSPNDLGNPVDQYIMNGCVNDPTVLRVLGNKWSLQPNLFPVWQRTNKTFWMFKGSSSNPPRIIEDAEVKRFNDNELIAVPIDIKQNAIEAPARIMRNFCGIPTGLESKLIANHDLIESLFTPSLKNFYTFEYAPASKPPEGLLWNLVKSQFFVPTGKKAGDSNLYQFWRYPNADRFISIDLAVKKDMASISMCHLERLKKGTHAGEKIYVVDFTLPILATKEEINLDAFKFLIHDMAKYGGIQFKRISYDQFQSVTSQQYLTRHGFDVERFSVDISVEPYYSFVSYMQQGRVKLGRNLIIKNNLKSLVNKKEDGKKLKVDHEQGNWFDLENQDWTTSKAGYFGKDGSDSLVACIGLADLYGTDSADYFWNEEEEQLKLERGSSSLVLVDLKKRWNLTPVRR